MRIAAKTETIPLFLGDPRAVDNPALQALDFAGSGVLLTYGNRQFVVTAAHVIDPERPYVMLGGAQESFFLKTAMKRDNRGSRPDIIDFAAAELNWEESRALLDGGQIRFVQLDTKTPYEPRLFSENCRLVGYLGTSNRITPKSDKLPAFGLTVEATTTRKHLKHDAHRRKNRHWFIDAEFDPNDAFVSETYQGVVPKTWKDFAGFSGGAIFRKESITSDYYTGFAGIIQESQSVKAGRLIRIKGIGTAAIIDMLRRWFGCTPTPPPRPTPPQDPTSQ